MPATSSEISILERFPLEILQDIFILSNNPDFPLVSRSLQAKLCQEFSLQRLIINVFWKPRDVRINDRIASIDPHILLVSEGYSQDYVDKWPIIRKRLLLRAWISPRLIRRASRNNYSCSRGTQSRPVLAMPEKLLQVGRDDHFEHLHRFLSNHTQIYRQPPTYDNELASECLRGAIQNNMLDTVILLSCDSTCFVRVNEAYGPQYNPAHSCHTVQQMFGWTGWGVNHSHGISAFIFWEGNHTWHHHPLDLPFCTMRILIENEEHIKEAFTTATKTGDTRAFKFLLITKTNPDAVYDAGNMKSVWGAMGDIIKDINSTAMQREVVKDCRRFYEQWRVMRRSWMLEETDEDAGAYNDYVRKWVPRADRVKKDDYDGSALVRHRDHQAKDLHGWGPPVLEDWEIEKEMSFGYDHRVCLKPNPVPHSNREHTSKVCISKCVSPFFYSEKDSARPRSLTF